MSTPPPPQTTWGLGAGGTVVVDGDFLSRGDPPEGDEIDDPFGKAFDVRGVGLVGMIIERTETEGQSCVLMFCAPAETVMVKHGLGDVLPLLGGDDQRRGLLDQLPLGDLPAGKDAPAFALAGTHSEH